MHILQMSPGLTKHTEDLPKIAICSCPQDLSPVRKQWSVLGPLVPGAAACFESASFSGLFCGQLDGCKLHPHSRPTQSQDSPKQVYRAEPCLEQPKTYRRQKLGPLEGRPEVYTSRSSLSSRLVSLLLVQSQVIYLSGLRKSY